jgi:hypothetical protein
LYESSVFGFLSVDRVDEWHQMLYPKQKCLST